MRSLRPRTVAFAVALVVVIAAAFEPVVHNGFVAFDDPMYITGNPHLRAGLTWQTAAWALTTTWGNFWHPLTWLSILLDVRLWGFNPALHHLTGVVLHAVSTLLLFFVLWRATGAAGRSFFVAAIFAVHPLHVESVAWAAERKDTLSTVFWMLTLAAYVAYARERRLGRYAIVVISFALGLLAKPMLVTLPLVLLLLDVWPLKRLQPGTTWRRLVLEKLPLLALSAVAGVIVLLTEHSGGAVADVRSFPIAGRIANALVAYATYPLKAVWPVRLVPFYPYPIAIRVGAAVAAAIVLVAVSLLVVRAAPRRSYLAVGWFWYVITLAPVSGLIQIGSHAMADRYTYVPLVGLSIAVAWGLSDLAGRSRIARAAVPMLCGAVIAACAVTAGAQVETWKDDATLWQHALRVMPDNYYAHNALGLELLKQGRPDEAMAHFLESRRLAPGFPNARENIGLLLAARGRTAEAIAEYQVALQAAPDRARTHICMANALLVTGRLDDAIEHYHDALRLDPGSAEAHTNLGSALQRAGRTEEALAQHHEAVVLNPELADAHYNLANALQQAGRLDEAIAEYEEALRLEPRSAETHANLGTALQKRGRLPEAVREYEAALAIDSKSPQALGNLGILLLDQGKAHEAADRFRAALRIDPSNAEMHTALGSALADLGRLDEAIVEHEEAIRLDAKLADAHYNLAHALTSAGRLEAAAAEYRETLRLEGDSPDVRDALDAVLTALRRAHR